MGFTVRDLDRSHIAYVRQQLAAHAECGRLLGRLLGSLELEAGRLWALVPSERADEAATDLELDAIRSAQERDALMTATTRELRPLLDESSRRLLVFEWCNPVEDLHASPAHAFLVGDSRFDYATAADADELVVRLLGAALWFPTVGVLAAQPSGVTLPGTRELTTADVEQIVDRLELLLVGAWDADGYVLWSPAARRD